MGILSRLGFGPRSSGPPSGLRGLTVELSSHCGYDCAPCPLNFYTEEVKRTHADKAQLLATLAACAPIDVVDFTGWGEGLLHPDLFEIVRAASRAAPEVTLTTAGSLLTEERSLGLIDAGLSYLMVSLDCASAATYRTLKHKDEFDLVCANIDRFIQLRGRASLPRVSLSFVVMRENLDEARAFAELARELGVDQIVFKTVAPFESAELARSVDSHYYKGLDATLALRAQRVIAEAADVATRADIEVATFGDFRSSERHACMAYAESRPYLRADGAVSPCCMAAYPVQRVSREGQARSLAPVVFGEFKKRGGLEKAWEREEYRSFRKSVKYEDLELPDACRDCPICHNFRLNVRATASEREAAGW